MIIYWKRKIEMAKPNDSGTEKIRQKAMKSYEKAMKLRSKEKFPKVAKHLRNTIKLFSQIRAYKEVEKVTIRLVEMALVEKENNIAAVTLLDAANVALLLNERIKAYEHYKSAINFYVDAPRANKAQHIMHAASFASFVRLTQGRFNEGVSFFKKHLKNNKYQSMNKEKLFQFTEEILNFTITKKPKFLEQARTIRPNLRLKEGEARLIDELLLISKEFLNFKSSINLDPVKISAGDQFNAIISVKNPQKITLLDSSIVYDANRLELSSDLVSNPDQTQFTVGFKAKIEGESQVGPITLLIQTDNEMKFPIVITKKLKIQPGKPGVQVIIEEQQFVKGEKNEFIVILSNSGKGEASNLTLSLEFPETLLFIGGINTKKLHSLKGNAKFPISFLITPLTSEEFKGKCILTYTDDYKKEFMFKSECIIKVI